MSDGPVCPHLPEHPLIERRLRLLEEWKEDVMNARVEDMNRLNDKLGEVHEKVNTVANKMSTLDGKFFMLVAGAGLAGPVVIFVLEKLFGKG